MLRPESYTIGPRLNLTFFQILLFRHPYFTKMKPRCSLLNNLRTILKNYQKIPNMHRRESCKQNNEECFILKLEAPVINCLELLCSFIFLLLISFSLKTNFLVCDKKVDEIFWSRKWIWIKLPFLRKIYSMLLLWFSWEIVRMI